MQNAILLALNIIFYLLEEKSKGLNGFTESISSVSLRVNKQYILI